MEILIILFSSLSLCRRHGLRIYGGNFQASGLSPFYRLTTFDKAMEDFLGSIWNSRSLTDATIYPLVKE